MKFKNFIVNLITILIVAEACSKTNKIRRTENPFRPLTPHKKIVKSKTGFDRGLPCEKILGQCDEKTEEIVKMKWKYRSNTTCVHIEKAKLKCPQIVVQYFENIVLDHYKKELKVRKNELDQCKSELIAYTKLDQKSNFFYNIPVGLIPAVV